VGSVRQAAQALVRLVALGERVPHLGAVARGQAARERALCSQALELGQRDAKQRSVGVNGVGDRPPRVGRAERMAHVQHVTKEPERTQEDTEDQHLLALQRPALDLLHRSEDARVLGVGVKLRAGHGRQPLKHTLAAVAESSIPVCSAHDLPARMIVDDPGLGHVERFARL
jgi:hypothetical protein